MNERSFLQIITGNHGGGILVTGTDAVTGEWDALVVNRDTVIEAIKVDSVDVTSVRGLTGETLSAGMFIGAGFNYNASGAKSKITSIKLTSGSVIMY